MSWKLSNGIKATYHTVRAGIEPGIVDSYELLNAQKPVCKEVQKWIHELVALVRFERRKSFMGRMAHRIFKYNGEISLLRILKKPAAQKILAKLKEAAEVSAELKLNRRRECFNAGIANSIRRVVTAVRRVSGNDAITNYFEAFYNLIYRPAATVDALLEYLKR